MVVSLIPLVVFFGSTVATGRIGSDTCYSFGVILQQGDQFIVHMGSICVKFWCDHGNWILHESGCLRDGKCYFMGDPFNINCTKYECTEQMEPYKYVFRPVKQDTCCSWEGKNDYEDGKLYLIPNFWLCYTTECVEGNWRLNESNCIEDDGTCHVIGSEYYMNGCDLYICTRNSSGAWNHEFLEQHCDTGSKCEPEGAEYYMNGCSSYICNKDALGNAENTLKERHCTDLDGLCHQPGESFPYTIGEDHFDNCTCRFYETNSEYLCNVESA